MRSFHLTCVFAVALTGCGGTEVQRVSGALLLDHQPLHGVAVSFFPENDLELGVLTCQVTSEDGTFDIVPEGDRGQGRAGDFLVLVGSESDMALMMVVAKGGKQGMARIQDMLGRPFLPLKYATEETTPLKATLHKGINDLEPFELKSEPFPRCVRPKVLRSRDGV